MSSKRLNLISFVVTGVLSGLVGAAWACTPQPRISTIGPGYGPSGSQMTISGTSFHGVEGRISEPVQIRWNTLNGPKLADAFTDARGNLAVTVTVPDVAPGVYTVLTDGEVSGVTRTSFEVVAPVSSVERTREASAPSSVSSELWEGFGQDSGSIDDPVTSGGPHEPNSMAGGLALSAVGTIVLAGVGTAAISRRRRQTA